MTNKKIILIVLAALALLAMVVLLCSRCHRENPAGTELSTDTTASSAGAHAEFGEETTMAPAGDSTADTSTNATTDTTVVTTIPGETTPATDNVGNGVSDNPFGTESTDVTAPTEESTPDSEPPVPTDPPATMAPTEPSDTLDELTYEEYMSLSAAEQKAYRDTFESIDAYFVWYNAAKAEYDAQNPGIEVGNGSIDLGDIIGGNG